MSVAERVVVVWFASAAVIELATHFVLLGWLIWRKVPLRFLSIGVPGYLEAAYAKRCREEGRSPRRVLLLKRLSLVNMILAAAAFIPLAAANR
jgi:hypothetical protein